MWGEMGAARWAGVSMNVCLKFQSCGWVGGRAGDVFARIPANFVLFVSDKKLNAQHSLNA